MQNVISFPTGGTAAPDHRSAHVSGNEQQVFSEDQAAQLTYEDGCLYGWASREGRLPAYYWRLETDLKDLVGQHGIVMAALRLALPVPFVRGWAVELGVDNPGRARALQASNSSRAASDTASPCAVSPLADDAFLWSGTPACA